MNYAEKVWDTINRAWNGDLKVHLEPVVYPAETTEKEDAPKKPVGEEYSNDRFSGGWDCSDEEYNYSAYVRDVINAGW